MFLVGIVSAIVISVIVFEFVFGFNLFNGDLKPDPCECGRL